MKTTFRKALVVVAGGLLCWWLASPAWAAGDDAGGGGAPKAGKQTATKPAAKSATTKPAPQPAPKDEGPTIPPEDPWLQSQAGRMTLSGLAAGPPLDNVDLWRNVLLVVYLDNNEKTNKQLLPMLARLDAEYGRQGLVVVGMCRDKEIPQEFPFAVFRDGFVPDTKFDKLKKLGMPYAYVLDHQGKVVFEDRPGNTMLGVIRTALSRRPDPVIGGGKYPRSSAILMKIRSGRFGEALALCQKVKERGGDAGQEAQELDAKIQEHAKRELSRARRIRTRAPLHALNEFEQIKKAYAGTPYADQADAALKELAADESLQKEMKAEKESRGLIRALGQVEKYPKAASDSRKRAWVQKYGETVKAAKSMIGRLNEKYPGAKAVKQAEGLLDERWPAK